MRADLTSDPLTDHKGALIIIVISDAKKRHACEKRPPPAKQNMYWTCAMLARELHCESGSVGGGVGGANWGDWLIIRAHSCAVFNLLD